MADPTPQAEPHRLVAPYAMRVVLGLAGLLYFRTAGQVTGFLPLPRGAVLALIAAYVVANALLLAQPRRAGFLPTVALDLVMLTVIVLEDPYPAAPVTVLLLSTTFDYARLLPPAIFNGATALAMLILLLNVWARQQSHQFPLAPEGAWLSGAIGVLMINFFAAARAAARVRAERRRMAARIEELNRRQDETVRLQLRLARVGECLQFTGQSRMEFARAALDCFVHELGALAGAVYELEQDGGTARLFPLATYAVDLARLQRRHIGLDEGLVGACARHGKAIELEHVPEGYFRLESGLGRGDPPRLLLVPLKVQTRLAGVMEMALNEAPGAETREVLNRMLPVFAAGLLATVRDGWAEEPASAGSIHGPAPGSGSQAVPAAGVRKPSPKRSQ